MMDTVNLIGKLSKILTDMTNEGLYAEGVTQLQEELKITGIVHQYMKADIFNEEDKTVILLIIKILQEVFNNSDVMSPVSDNDYDMLYELNREINGVEIVGASVGSGDKPMRAHRYPDLRGTLDKIHFITEEERGTDKRKSLEYWLRSLTTRLGRPLTKEESLCVLTPKWDGISLVFENDGKGNTEVVLTRGDTQKNEAVEVTKLFKGTNMSKLNDFNNGDFGVKTEAVVTRKNFEELCKKFGDLNNTRSAASSILNTKELDPKYLPYLTVIPLLIQNYETKEIMVPNATYAFPFSTVSITDIDAVSKSIAHLKETVETLYGIDIDGVVLRLAAPHVQRLLGREENINKFEVAYKFPPEQRKAIVRTVEYSVGPLGGITPMVKIEPIVMKGNTIKSINIGSTDILEELDIRVGDEVIIGYDVIPTLKKDDTCRQGLGQPFRAPDVCPYCKHDLVKEPVLKCINEDCDSRAIGKIFNYVTKMKIPNISIGTITKLYKYEFLKTIASLYDIERVYKLYIIDRVPGMGAVSVQRIIDGINLRRTVYDYELLGAIGIPEVAEKTFKKILNIYYLPELLEICEKGDESKLTKIKGIGKNIAEKIVKGINSNLQLIMFLGSDLKIVRDERKYTIKVVFTKVRDKDFEEFLMNKDVLVMESYTDEVDMVIVPSLSVESSKVDKAKKKGKSIVPITDAYKMFGYTPGT